MTVEPQEPPDDEACSVCESLGTPHGVPVAQEPPAPHKRYPDAESAHEADEEADRLEFMSAQEPPVGNDGLTDAERAAYAAQWRATYGQKPTAAEADEWLASAQEPADPPQPQWVFDAVRVAHQVVDSNPGDPWLGEMVVRAALPILRAGTRAELIAEQVNAMKPGRQS